MFAYGRHFLPGDEDHHFVIFGLWHNEGDVVHKCSFHFKRWQLKNVCHGQERKSVSQLQECFCYWVEVHPINMKKKNDINCQSNKERRHQILVKTKFFFVSFYNVDFLKRTAHRRSNNDCLPFLFFSTCESPCLFFRKSAESFFVFLLDWLQYQYQNS